MSKHTPGRVKVQHPHAGPRGWEVAFEPGLEQLCQNITEDNARRLVACWNACDGIETYALELMTGNLSIKEQITATGKQKPKQTSKTIEYRRQRDELLAACKAMLACCYDLERNEETLAAVKTTMAAIAKATGELP